MRKDNSISSTFCVLPWIHMATRTWGGVGPCCVAHPFEENLNNESLSQIWNGEEILTLRKKMMNGEKSSFCKKCYIEEKMNIPSQRIRSNAQWEQFLSFKELIKKTKENGFYKGKFIYLDLRLGNKCNLVCNMCGPFETNHWDKMARAVYDHAKSSTLKEYMKKRIVNIDNSPLNLWYKRKEVIQDIYESFPYIKHLTFAGGEPFLIKEHYDLIDECIRRNEAHHIRILYHTNGTVLDTRLFDKWKHFESVTVFVSIDELKERNHYIRYPCEWERLEGNLKILDENSPSNTHVMILYTIQAMNIFYIPEFLDWFSGKQYKKVHSYYDDVIHTELVYSPYFLSCQIIPSPIKKLINKKFKDVFDRYGKKAERLQGILDYMNQADNSRFLPVFKDYVEALDKIRHTCFPKTFPELSELLNKYQG